MVRSMMSFIELPLSFWGYTLETMTKLLNMAPSKTLAKTPYEIMHGKPASYKHLTGFPPDTQREELFEELSEATPQAGVASSSVPVVPSENTPILWRSTRVSLPPERYGLLVIDQSNNYLNTNEEAMSDIDLGKWLEAMRPEMDSSISNKICTLVNQSKGFKPIGCKCIYNRKLGADGGDYLQGQASGNGLYLKTQCGH
ncbi:UNVERIFIED_CONTAM: hypothetical protein Sindi_1657200 [Sesamum indicum]